jgi:pimeloyl-ACP methyl ester carboxylesterase
MRIRHGRIALELHVLAQRQDPALLLLHGLGGCSRDWHPLADAWPGSLYALDFSGHGDSQWVAGRAYDPELLLGDADAALAAIGPTALAGVGLGAYIALLLAGARPERVPAALLLSGPGLAGAGSVPDVGAAFPAVLISRIPAGGTERRSGGRTSPDPRVVVLDCFAHPPDYAARFACTARRLLLLEDADPPPPWWTAVRESAQAEVVSGDPAAALHRLWTVVSREPAEPRVDRPSRSSRHSR